MTYSYDTDDNLIKVKDSKGLTVTYTYDKNNNVTKCKRSDGTITTYTYDALNQMTKLSNKKGGKIISSFAYTYDGNGRITKENVVQKGQNTKKTFTYDKANQLTGYTEKKGGKVSKTTYSYDASGNRISVTSGTKGKIVTKYNDDNQMISQANKKTGETIRYQYDKQGNMIAKNHNGSETTYDYDIENRLTAVSEGGQILMSATYDGEDNKVFQMTRKTVATAGTEDETKKTTNKGDTHTNTGKYFDPEIFEYGFTQGVTKSSMGANTALTAGVTSIINKVWKGQTTYKTTTADDPDELSEIVIPGTDPGTAVTYDLTYYVNDINQQNPEVLMEYSADGDEKATYTYGNERLTADLTREATKYTDQTPGLTTYLYDAHNSVTENLDSDTGQITKEIQYDPYGQPTSGVNDNDDLFAYNGEQYTEVTGLQYLRARYYSPRAGTFITQDTYQGSQQNPTSQNRYTYGENNPVNGEDPSGHIFGWIKKKVKKLGRAIKRTAKKVVRKVKQVAKKVVRKVKRAVKRVVRKVKKTYTKAKNYVKKQAKKVKAIAKKAKAFAKKTIKKATALAKKIIKKGINLAKKATAKLLKMAKKAGKAVYKAVKKAIQKAKAKAKAIAKKAKALAKKAAAKIKAAAKKAAAKVKKVACAAAEAIKKNAAKILEVTHVVLDVVGMIPIVGEVADGLNALVYVAEGDYVNAALSASSMIPIAGNAVAGTRLALKAADVVPDLLKGLGKGADVAKGADEILLLPAPKGKAINNTGADNITTAAKQKEYYRQAESYGKSSIKELENGKYRFYGEIKPAKTEGTMAGRRVVREWDPDTGGKRTWQETLDHEGNIRQVRPDEKATGGKKVHYTFDEQGNYTGKW